MTEDKFQERYLAHQARKREMLLEIMKERHSDRIFSDQKVERCVIDTLMEAQKYCPSSCDRQAIELSLIQSKDLKILLSALLVGGVGWAHRADGLILIFASREAYKAENEVEYMPFLDAGVVVQQLYLSATALGLKGCFINPNIRDLNKNHFNKIFSGENKVFCGAFAFGY